jgi:alcohol dehydrogenase class IV
VGLGAATGALPGTFMRGWGARDPEAMAHIARALGAWQDGDALDTAPERAVAALEKLFRSIDMPIRLSELDISRDSLPRIVERSLKNFNADPKREFVRERELLLSTLEQAW